MKKHTNSWFWFACLALLLVACGGEETAELDPMAKKKSILPIIGNRDVEYRTVDGKEVADTIYHTVPGFEYLNADSTWVSSKKFENKVRVVDFFFTHCGSICPAMTSQMRRLNTKTQDLAKEVQFLSFSIDPERDTPTRLREYKKNYKITTSNWEFFTGNEAATHLLAKEFFNGAQRDDKADGGFGHTTYFALVDREGYVRGIYDGTNADAVDQLEKDLRKLLKDEYNVHGTK